MDTNESEYLSYKKDTDQSVYFKRWIILLFILLACGIEGLIFCYWQWFLEPQIIEKARITAAALAEPHARIISESLENIINDPEIVSHETDLLKKSLHRIFLLTIPDTHIPFFSGVRLEIDDEWSELLRGKAGMRAGVFADSLPFIITIPLFAEKTRELIGIAVFSPNPLFIRHYQSDVKEAFMVVAAVIFGIFIMAGGVIFFLLSRMRKTEAALREKQAQVIHAGRLTALGEMATGIAHELNQPLAIIRIAADGLNRYFNKVCAGDMERTAAAKITDQVNRAAGIINNMRSFARAENSDVKTADPTDLRLPMDRALSFFREQFKIHGIRLDVSLPDTLPFVRVHEQKFEQIIVNLLTNARYAVEKKAETVNPYVKTVSVSLHPDETNNHIILTVSDNGIGMSSKILDRCMEPFFTTKPVGRGTGLGLSIVHSIARESGIVSDVKSAENRGTAFCLLIPIVKTQDNPDPQP